MSCLIIVDVQNDFLEDGPFALANSRSIIPAINAQLDQQWDLVVASRDWHPANHISFASSQNKQEYAPIVLSNGKKNVESLAWPTHCVAGTPGADLDPLLQSDKINVVLDKGTDESRECFSAFKDVFGDKTPLEQILKQHEIHTVYVCGVVTEYCVRHTAVDSADLGFKTVLLQDCVFPITEKGGHDALEEMKARGVRLE